MSHDVTSTIAANMRAIAEAQGAIFAAGTDYPAGTQVPPHSHDRHQLMHGLSGVLMVSTPAGHWIVPPEHALWIPAGCTHWVEMLGAVRMRSVYVRPGDIAAQDSPRVLGMTPLVRALLVEAVGMANRPEEAFRDRLVAELLLTEIPRLPEQPLALPLPVEPRLLRLCRAFIAAPDARASLDDWATRAGMSRRSLSRHFRTETGLSLDHWRQQACVFAALPRLIEGEKVTTVALDLGYDSPAAFTTMFRRMLGETPRAYARR
ncbi:AraC family transcriptional regulator [Seohaeicola zhoushanensis]|uniref:AraC family transcriptional regulator n=1 Tax=Seohaeicola zhoushanensis TaxID=1569283 RepID=A0A8J3GVC8_9RHOB|nr:helix-turn-helix transcriptional regulator [Seohaeicola zhoushanensis]GHF38316.1 AraC family transcriptional regulator [Seohaeicola zhoushanensis]